MKRIVIFLIIILFFITGCQDYKELENLAYVSSIGIDFDNDLYTVTYEILSSKKENDKVLFDSYTVYATSDTISNAFLKAAEKTKLYPYFAHADLLVINKTIAENKLQEIVDFIIRENEVREFFYFCVANNAQEILNTKTEENPVAALTIKKQLEINKYSKIEFHAVSFDDFINNIENFKQDNAVPYINIFDGEIEIQDMVAFKGYNLKTPLEENNNYIYNMFLQDNNKYYQTGKFNNGLINMGITFNKKKIDIIDNQINIYIEANGNIINNQTDFNLKNTNDINEINIKFKETIEQDIYNFITFLKENDLDLLGFKNNYYIKYRTDINSLWEKFNVNIYVDFKLAKKGIIYDSLQNNKS